MCLRSALNSFNFFLAPSARCSLCSLVTYQQNKQTINLPRCFLCSLVTYQQEEIKLKLIYSITLQAPFSSLRYSVSLLFKYAAYCTVYTVQCTLYNVHCTVYTIENTTKLYNVHCTVYPIENTTKRIK